jgi:hypothetical protein
LVCCRKILERTDLKALEELTTSEASLVIERMKAVA